jgi:hypothetical protein
MILSKRTAIATNQFSVTGHIGGVNRKATTRTPNIAKPNFHFL